MSDDDRIGVAMRVCMQVMMVQWQRKTSWLTVKEVCCCDSFVLTVATDTFSIAAKCDASRNPLN